MDYKRQKVAGVEYHINRLMQKLDDGIRRIKSLSQTLDELAADVQIVGNSEAKAILEFIKFTDSMKLEQQMDRKSEETFRVTVDSRGLGLQCESKFEISYHDLGKLIITTINQLGQEKDDSSLDQLAILLHELADFAWAKKIPIITAKQQTKIENGPVSDTDGLKEEPRYIGRFQLINKSITFRTFLRQFGPWDLYYQRKKGKGPEVLAVGETEMYEENFFECSDFPPLIVARQMVRNLNLEKGGPRYTHDCRDCIFLDQHQGLDLYFHPGGVGETNYIARYGEENSEFINSKKKQIPSPLLDIIKSMVHRKGWTI